MPTHSSSPGGNQPPVTFSIDGVDFTADDRRPTAAQLLALAGLDPADYDLARVVGHGEVEKSFRDSQEIQLTPGAKFVSVFTGATPVT